ncbi:hypothetical protein GCM10009733_059600 [Nonomuraea maheshkhaliensis]|uniref:Secreted protein n=1 Tax=Nonomuraea maheshkhaliensis TaxID=419590 RepID=A0ABP4RKF6_9ACTN
MAQPGLQRRLVALLVVELLELLLAQQVGLGDDAEDPAGVVDHRDGAYAVFDERFRDVLERGVRVHREHLAGHDLVDSDVHRAPPSGACLHRSACPPTVAEAEVTCSHAVGQAGGPAKEAPSGPGGAYGAKVLQERTFCPGRVR